MGSTVTMRIMRRYLIVSAVLLMLLLLFDCTKDITSATETDTGEIIGWVFNNNNQAVAGADVILHDADGLMIITAGNVAQYPAKTKRIAGRRIQDDSTKTTPAGFFTFSSVAPGNYIVEVNDHDTSGGVGHASISDTNLQCTVDTIIPKPYGAIQGSINTSLAKGDSVFLYIVELDRRVPVDSLGHFLITNVPAVDYTIRLVDGDTIVPSVLDTVTLSVTERDTADAYHLGSSFGDISVEGNIREH